MRTYITRKLIKMYLLKKKLNKNSKMYIYFESS